MTEIEYCGYRIRYHFTNQWFTHIYPPGATLALGGDTITATKDEGEAILLARARKRIDDEIKQQKA